MISQDRQAMFVRFIPILLVFLLLAGCTTYGGRGGDSSQGGNVSSSQPYYPPDFREVLIPDGLNMNRDNSMYIKTSSFNGGVLNFEGRIDVISLSDFFEGSMPKNGWRLSGVVKAKNYLLIFTKPDKTCMITISENKLNFNTIVNIYISQEAADGAGGAMAPEESFSVSPLE
jgi:predicted small secreted protein